MGTSLSYQTTAPVPDSRRSRVVAELTAISDGREWWAESILLYDAPGLPGHNGGDTKLFCLIDDGF